MQEPALRLATIEAAGKAGVPYTSGILIGIGETRLERIESLLAIRDLHQQYGHIQVGCPSIMFAKHYCRTHPTGNVHLSRKGMAVIVHSPTYGVSERCFVLCAGAHHTEFCAKEEHSDGCCGRAPIHRASLDSSCS